MTSASFGWTAESCTRINAVNFENFRHFYSQHNTHLALNRKRQEPVCESNDSADASSLCSSCAPAPKSGPDRAPPKHLAFALTQQCCTPWTQPTSVTACDPGYVPVLWRNCDRYARRYWRTIRTSKTSVLPSEEWFIELTWSRRKTRKLVDFLDKITWIPRGNRVDPRHQRVFDEPFLTGDQFLRQFMSIGDKTSIPPPPIFDIFSKNCVECSDWKSDWTTRRTQTGGCAVPLGWKALRCYHNRGLK